MAADAEADELVAAAAGIICSMRGADLAGWTPPWRKPEPAAREGELIWPAVARGKRSRRRSPSAGSSGGKARWGRASPASPLDYSGGSGSGASTSGGEDGAFCSQPEPPAFPPAAAAAACQQLAAPGAPAPPSPPSKVRTYVRAHAPTTSHLTSPSLSPVGLVWSPAAAVLWAVGCFPIRVRAWLDGRTDGPNCPSVSAARG